MKYLIIVLFLLLLLSCASNESNLDRSLEKMRKSALGKINVEECSKKGGKVEGIGMFGIPECVLYYEDGGKACQGNNECMGNCFNPDVLEAGTKVSGKCESSQHDSIGCYSVIENGRIEYNICVD